MDVCAIYILSVLCLLTSNTVLSSGKTFDASDTGISSLIGLNISSLVESINLEENGIVELSESEFSDYVRLKELYLSKNKLVSISPKAFKYLTLLHTLDLSQNKLVELPFLEDVNETLKTLKLNGNPLSATDSLEHYKSLVILDVGNVNTSVYPLPADVTFPLLQKLYLDRNNLAQLPDGVLNTFPSLLLLSLKKNKLEDNALVRLTSSLPEGGYRLQALNLAYNNIKKFSNSFFDAFPYLKVFNCTMNPISVFPATLWPSLETINLQGASGFTLAEAFLDFIPNAKTVNIEASGMHILPVLTTKASLVQFLGFKGNSITSLPNNSFQNCTNLEYLSLEGNMIQELRSDIFGPENTNLTTLYLGYNQIAYIETGAFQHLVNLRSLKLEGNLLTEFPEAVSTLYTLDTLVLAYNEIDSIPQDSLHNLENMTYFDISHNRLASMPNLMCGGTNLKIFDLGMNRINFVPDTYFQYLPRLTRLLMSHNNLTVMPNVTNLKFLKVLRVSQNNIQHIPHGYLDGLPLLQHLDIGGNNLGSFDIYQYKELQLKYLDVGRNPLQGFPNIFRTAQSISTLWLDGLGLKELPTNFTSSFLNVKILRLQQNELNEILDMNPLSSLQHLYLESNPLHCGNDICWMKLLNNRYTVHLDQYPCQEPTELHNISWDHITKLMICPLCADMPKYSHLEPIPQQYLAPGSDGYTPRCQMGFDLKGSEVATFNCDGNSQWYPMSPIVQMTCESNETARGMKVNFKPTEAKHAAVIGAIQWIFVAVEMALILILDASTLYRHILFGKRNVLHGLRRMYRFCRKAPDTNCHEENVYIEKPKKRSRVKGARKMKPKSCELKRPDVIVENSEVLDACISISDTEDDIEEASKETDVHRIHSRFPIKRQSKSNKHE